MLGERPRILSDIDDVTVTSPDVAVLECRVKPGSEDTEISWFKDARPLRSGRKYEMLFWDDKASLVVKETEPSDNGTYRCVLSNEHGKAEASARLTVYSEYLFAICCNIMPVTVHCTFC